MSFLGFLFFRFIDKARSIRDIQFMALVSYREYARQKGISLAALQDRIKRGTITERAIDRTNPARPKINVELADEDFAQRRSTTGELSNALQKKPNLTLVSSPEPNPPTKEQSLDPAGSNVIDEMFDPPIPKAPADEKVLDKKLKPLEKPEKITKIIDGKEVDVTKIPYAGEDNFDRFRKAKAGSEEIKARILELELAEMEGRLVDVTDVKKELQKICITIRESILNVPAKVAPNLLSCTQLVEIESMLYKELNEALQGLSSLLNERGNIK